MQRQNYAALAGVYNSVSAGALLYAAALPGPDYELANAYPSTPYEATVYPNLAKVSQGRTGKIIEAAASVPPSYEVCKIPGTEHYFCHGPNNTTLYYRNGWNGTWTAVGSTGGTGRSGGGEVLLTRCVFFTDQTNTIFVTGPAAYTMVATKFVAMAEGNGRFCGGRPGQLSYASIATTPTFTDYALAGNWVKVFWCGGNNWVAFADNGDVAKSTDNGTTWAKTTSITNKSIPNVVSRGWGNEYQIVYDSVNDKFYIASGPNIYVCSLATSTTAWTLEAVPDAAENVFYISVTKQYVFVMSNSGTWICKRGTTTYRKIGTFGAGTVAGLYSTLLDTTTGYLVLDYGTVSTKRIANGVDTFDPNRDLSQGDLNPYLKFR